MGAVGGESGGDVCPVGDVEEAGPSGGSVRAAEGEAQTPGQEAHQEDSEGEGGGPAPEPNLRTAPVRPEQ